jgi:hypothetical protein
MASQARRLRRLEERQTNKFYEKIRIETMNKLKTMTPEQRVILEEEHKQFLKDRDNV